MTTVLSPNKGYSLQQTGDNNGTWGVVLDGTLSIIDLNMGGDLTVDVTGGSNVTVNSTQAQNICLRLTGVLSGNISLLLPATGSFYIIDNQSTGAHTITVKTTAGGSTGIVVPQGLRRAVFSDGTNVAPFTYDDGQLFDGTDAGTGSAYVVTGNGPITALATGQKFSFTPANNSAANATLNWNGIGARKLYAPSSSGPQQVALNAIIANQPVFMIYNASLDAGTGGFLIVGGLVVAQSSTFTDSVTVVSTDAGATAAPLLDLYRNSATPVSADLLGVVDFTGQNSTPAKATYAFVEARIDDPTAASEDGSLLLGTANAGSLGNRVTIGQGVQVGAPTGGDKGPGTVNATALYVNGASVSAGAVAAGTISGLLPTSIAGSSTTASLTVTAGQAADSTSVSYLTLGSQAWAVSNGNAINGYSGGTTLPNSSTIHFFICSGASGTGIFASNSLTPTFPTGYTTFTRRIFSLKTNSSGALLPGVAIEISGGAMEFYLSTPTTDASNVTLVSANRVLTTINLPLGIKVQWVGRAAIASVSSGTLNMLLTSPDEPDTAVTALALGFSDNIAANSVTTTGAPSTRPVTSNTSGQIGVRGSATNGGYTLTTSGWIDFRRS